VVSEAQETGAEIVWLTRDLRDRSVNVASHFADTVENAVVSLKGALSNEMAASLRTVVMESNNSTTTTSSLLPAGCKSTSSEASCDSFGRAISVGGAITSTGVVVSLSARSIAGYNTFDSGGVIGLTTSEVLAIARAAGRNPNVRYRYFNLLLIKEKGCD
jgi:hypothetical protein